MHRCTLACLLACWLCALPAGAAELEDSPRWAFEPVASPALPTVAQTDWPLNPIDFFILAKLEEVGLSPSPQADRRTLIRRLALDLTGLPPSPEEVAAFFADERPDAYEQLVERLLASPQYGERWARHWLDVVRFAESHGFEMNQPRPNAWPYRDYVIRAFNDDKPYDQFVREQLAGDALGADEATGFLVGGAWDQVKSPDPVLTAEQRAAELHDMVSTTGSAFLGLTIGCARCHDHKFDPLTQRDYYALVADLAGVQHGERPWRQAASSDRAIPLAEAQSRLQEVERLLAVGEPLATLQPLILLSEQDPARTTQLVPPIGSAPHAPGAERGHASDGGGQDRWPNVGQAYLYWDDAAEQDLLAYRPSLRGRFRVWLSWGCGWETHTSDARYWLDADGDVATHDDRTLLATIDQRRFADGLGEPTARPLWSGFQFAGLHELTEQSAIVLQAGAGPQYVTADAIALTPVTETEEASLVTTAFGPAARPPVSALQNVERFSPVTARYVRFRVLATNQAEPCLDEIEIYGPLHPQHNLALASAGTRAAASSLLPGYAIHQIEHLNDGLYGNSRSWISAEPGGGWVILEMPEPREIDRVTWGRDREGAFSDRVPTGYTIEVSLDGMTWQEVASHVDRLSQAFAKLYRDDWLFPGAGDGNAAELQALREELTTLRAEIESLSSMPAVYAGVLQQPGVTYQFHRGDPQQPREEVPPAAIATLGAEWTLPGDSPEQERRLALAQWITRADNPLLGRVIVNRLWHFHFGQGIVNTPSDLGAGGSRPTHPELLDWLSGELAANGWRLKHLQRLIVCSQAYRQASAPRSDCLAVDGGTRLLWRFPARRLEAEAIRDSILWLSGVLDLRMGGPGFEAFELNENYVRVFEPRHEWGPDAWRRMIYLRKPRMELDGVFGVFDCPDAGQSTPRRTVSTTPLQVFNLLNDPFILEQADLLAQRLEREAGPAPAAQVRHAFELALSREPAADELASAEALVRQHGLPAFCRAMFNVSEFLFLP